MFSFQDLDSSWQNILQAQTQLPYFSLLAENLEREIRAHDIYPPNELVFSALAETSLPNTRVVILGQDPYHKPGQAHGLAFSVNDQTEGVVFLLWGSNAQSKHALIDTDRHLVLESVHPSPLSAYRGFLGCGHFSKANEYLVRQGKEPISWDIFP